ncbi:MAG: hypothetical protein AB7P02_21010 [Alphaproteobacteria bacterium]
MFGFSLSKLLTLVAIVVAVWVAFRWIGQMAAARDAGDRTPRRRDAPRPPPKEAVEDLVACPGCGAYVPARNPRGCGRRECPYPG